MKKFLDDLKKELIKLKFKSTEIKEILEDHTEMIEAAKNEGLSEEELATKFGNPAQLAKDLYENSEPTTIINEGGILMEGYQLWQAFPVVEKNFDITFGLVAEDVKLMIHDEEQIVVLQKHLTHPDDYELSFDGKELVIKRQKSLVRFSFRTKSPKFIVKVPRNSVSEACKFKFVSGDLEVEALETKTLEFKTTSGDLEIKLLHGETASLTTVSGDLEVKGGTLKELNVSMVSGDLELKNIKIDGPVSTTTVSGDMEVNNVNCGPVKFKTVSGDLDGENFYPENISFHSVSGDCEIENNDKTVKIEVIRKKTVSGSVKIK